MIGTFLAPLGAKVGFGLSLALVIALGVQTARVSSRGHTIEVQAAKIKTAEAERDRFKDALAFYVNAGQIQTERGKQALRDREPASAELRRQAASIRVVKVAGAGCATPTEVLSARGL